METLLDKINTLAQEKKLLESTAVNLVNFLRTPQLPRWACESIQYLIEKEQYAELNDRFFQVIAFGTAGMRGRIIGKVPTAIEKEGEEYRYAAVGSTCMNDFNVIRATIGLFNYCKSFLESSCEFPRRPSVVISYDTRYFSQHFCELVASTWTKLGGDAYIFEGPRSTPQLSFSVRYLKTTAGVMITASHNPFFDNGYKVYFHDGAQINETHATEITRRIQRLTYSDILPYLDKNLNNVFRLSPLVEEAYIECCKEAILDKPLFKRVNSTKVVYTPLHGTGSVCVLPLLHNYDWQVFPVAEQLKMDGGFPTVQSPNPDNRDTLALALEEAKRIKADGIIATDPDGDRMSVMMPDKHGEWQLLNGNTIAILLAEYRLNAIHRLGIFPKVTTGNEKISLIKSFVTTPILKSFAEKNNLRCIETHTGFKWIGEKLKDYEDALAKRLHVSGLCLDYTRCSSAIRMKFMLKYSSFFFFGAEESCGFLANDAVRDKDANAATLMFCELIGYLKSKKLNYVDYLNEIYEKYGYFKEDLLSFTFEGAEGMRKIQKLMQSFRSKEQKHIANVRILSHKDFADTNNMKDADGKPIPPSNFVVIQLINGCSLAIRPSGTEPKLKIYLFGGAPVTKEETLTSVKETVSERLESLKEWIKTDIQTRLN